MKKLFLLLLAVIPMMAVAQVKFVPSDFETAKAKAKQLGKDLIVDVIRGKQDTDNLTKTLQNKELVKFLNKNFYAVTIDMTKPENKDFGQHLYSLMYPCVVFYTNRGEQLESTGWFATANGKADLMALAQSSVNKATIKRSNTKKIEFRDIDYAQALEIAKQEGKMVFVDNYTSWCRPCKQMEMDVFTLNSVADFYNDNFICIKLDADKDPHKVAKKFGVRGFPAYLYIDGDGELVFEGSGFNPEKAFIAFGQEAKRSFVEDKEVKFSKISLDEAISIAQKENKFIYVNLSATWCGPCKQMKNTVFKTPSVARVLNNKFINLYIECDTDEATANMYKSKYGYSAFPTHLVLNSKGELMHKMVGGMKADNFIGALKTGLSNKGLAYYNETYKGGKRDAEFVTKYIEVLMTAYEEASASKVANDYLTSLSIEDLATEANFKFMSNLVTDLDNDIAVKVIDSKPIFVEKLGEATINRYISMLWSRKAMSYVKAGDKPTLDKKGYSSFLSRLDKESNLDESTIDMIKFNSNVTNAENLKDWKNYIKLTTSKIKKENGKTSLMVVYNWGLRVVKNVEDKALRSKFATSLECWLTKIDLSNPMFSMGKSSVEKLIEDLKK